MTPATRELFEHASRHVTLKHVCEYCPGDPGYAEYVREFSAILSSGVLPATSHFDISETIGLTRWVDASVMQDPVPFRRFRAFVNSVGVAIATGPGGPDHDMPPNYSAISLLDDAWALQDSHFLRLLSPVFAALHQRVVETAWFAGEAPFLSLGQLMLACMGFAPSSDIDRLCAQTVSEASQHAGHATPEFLWGCTFFNQLHSRWKHHVEKALPCHSANETLATLRTVLLS